MLLACLNSLGREFQVEGPIFVNALSPENFNLVQGISRRFESLDRNDLFGLWIGNNSWIYGGAVFSTTDL